jgi:hypothetical protein
MWKTLGSFWAQTSAISYILAEKTAHIHCAAVDLAFLRRPHVAKSKLPHRCKGRRCAKKIANKKATPAGGFLFDPQLMLSRQWRCRSLGWS